MKKLTAIAAIPLFAGFLMAQDTPQKETQTETTTTTKTTTWNGTLVDASCRAKPALAVWDSGLAR